MTIFFLSDHHFGHANICKFTIDDKGTRLRPFSSVEEMDELIVENHNKTVKPSDHFYALGDVAMDKRKLGIVQRLNGHKRLIMGNHDIYDYQEYVKAGFKKIMACRVLDNILFTHIPVHTSNLGRFKANVHGHIHAGTVMFEQTHPGWPTGMQPDRRYLNVCCEKLNYTPISLEEIKKLIQQP